MILYHGTTMDIKSIDLSKSNVAKDFGQGFYLTDDIEQAKTLAAFRASFLTGGTSVINAYEFDEATMHNGDMRVKIFEGYSIPWIRFVVANRSFRQKGCSHDYDIVYGPIANDVVGLQIRRFEEGIITEKQLIDNLAYPHGITFQYFFATERSIKLLKKLWAR